MSPGAHWTPTRSEGGSRGRRVRHLHRTHRYRPRRVWSRHTDGSRRACSTGWKRSALKVRHQTGACSPSSSLHACDRRPTGALVSSAAIHLYSSSVSGGHTRAASAALALCSIPRTAAATERANNVVETPMLAANPASTLARGQIYKSRAPRPRDGGCWLGSKVMIPDEPPDSLPQTVIGGFAVSH